MVETNYKFDWSAINYTRPEQYENHYIDIYENWSLKNLKDNGYFHSAMIYKANCEAFNITKSKRRLYQHKGFPAVLHMATHPLMASGTIKSINREHGISRDLNINHNVNNTQGNLEYARILPSRITLKMYFEWNTLRDKDILRMFLYRTFVDGKITKDDSGILNGMLYIKFPDVYDYEEDIFEEVFFEGFDIIEEDRNSVLIDINFLNPTGLKTYIEYASYSENYKSNQTGGAYNIKKFNVEEAFYGHKYQTEGDHTITVTPSFSILKQKPILFLDARTANTFRAFTSSKKYNYAGQDSTYFFRSSGIVTMNKSATYLINTISRQIVTIDRLPSTDTLKNYGLEYFQSSKSYESVNITETIPQTILAQQSTIFNFDDVLDVQVGQPFDIVPAMPFAVCWKNYII